ncbi:MAG: hypothetical protein HYS09_07685 [Chloroflexi bacterium]|nr:hypothetical protein [Chloroflexota bacterium]
MMQVGRLPMMTIGALTLLRPWAAPRRTAARQDQAVEVLADRRREACSEAVKARTKYDSFRFTSGF